MIPIARVHATLDLLCEVEGGARPADAITSAFFRAHRQFGEADRGDILERLYALLRHRGRLGWWLDRLACDDTPRHRLLAWLVLGEGQTPERIDRNLADLSEPEQRMLREVQGHAVDHPEMPEELRLECPAWAIGPLRRRFGAAFSAEMAAALAPAPLDLRVNPVKTTRSAVLRRLQDMGLRAEPTPLAPFGIRVHDRLSLARLPGLKTGEIEIQDEGSQLVALLVDAQPGDRVVDFCAGAGGKTLAIAAQMMNRGRVIACDVNAARLARCGERLRRAGLHNAETRVLASETDRWVKRHRGGFDRVLVDAPCSGTGTWRRNPDARWRAPDLGLPTLVAVQGRILASAARLVKPGGRLVYATCSVLGEENEAQVAAFLSTHPDFSVRPLGDAAPQVTGSAHPDHLALTPAGHGTDGFFAAILERKIASLAGTLPA